MFVQFFSLSDSLHEKTWVERHSYFCIFHTTLFLTQVMKPILLGAVRLFLQVSVRDQELSVGGLQNFQRRWAWNITSMYNCEDRCLG